MQTILVMAVAGVVVVGLVKGFQFLENHVGEGPLDASTVGLGVGLFVLAGAAAVSRRPGLAVVLSLLGPIWFAAEAYWQYATSRYPDAENFSNLILLLLGVPALAASGLGVGMRSWVRHAHPAAPNP